VSSIDALLRILICQKRQLREKTTSNTDAALFIQKYRDRNYPYPSERIIIEKAYTPEKVIDKQTKISLLACLKERNSFVHRIFLGNWQYGNIEKLIKKGDALIKNLQIRAEHQAKEQVRSNLIKGPAFRKTRSTSDEDQIQKTITKYFT